MENSFFLEITLVLALGAVVSVVMRLIKQPLIIGYIIAGLLASPSVLGIVQSGETLEGLSTIGIALLLFIVGLGLNPKVIKELGPVAGITGVTQVVFSSLVGTLIMLGLGRSFQESLVLGIALAFSSTIVGLKLLSDKKEQTRLYGRLAIGVLLVQDVLATVALVVVSASGEGASVVDFVILVIKGIAIGVPLFLFSNKVLPKATNFIGSNQEFLFLCALAWGFGIGALFKWAGFSLEVGALIAGVALASNSMAQEVSARLKPIRDFFIVVFFIFLGSNLAGADIFGALPLALLFSAIVLITNPIIIMIPLLGFKHTKLNSFRVGVVMAQISEFSLIFAVLAAQKKIVSQDIVELITLIALITIAGSSYMIIYTDKIFNALQRLLPFMRQSKRTNEVKTNHELVLFGYKKGGTEFVKVFKSLDKRYVVIDYDPEVIESLQQKDVPYLYGDATDIELLEEANISGAKLIISIMSDATANSFLIDWVNNNNPNAVVICAADTVQQAIELYQAGASYVMLPHYIGSEKIGAFIKKSNLSKAEFKQYREKHLTNLLTKFDK